MQRRVQCSVSFDWKERGVKQEGSDAAVREIQHGEERGEEEKGITAIHSFVFLKKCQRCGAKDAEKNKTKKKSQKKKQWRSCEASRQSGRARNG